MSIFSVVPLEALLDQISNRSPILSPHFYKPLFYISEKCICLESIRVNLSSHKIKHIALFSM